MDEERWEQMTVSQAPEAATNAVRHAEDGAGAPIPEVPPAAGTACRHAGDLMLRGVEQQPLAAVAVAAGIGLGLSLLGRLRFG